MMLTELAIPRTYARYPQAGAVVYHALCETLAGRPEGVDWLVLDAQGWQLLVRMAELEGVAPLVYRTLSGASCGASIPEAVMTVLEQAYFRTAAFNQVLFGELERILRGFAAGGVPVVVLKGAALAALLYPDPALRPMADLDLLAPPDALEKATQVIQELGYQKEKVTYHVYFRGGPGQNLAVELHWDLILHGQTGAALKPDWFWQGCRPWPAYAGAATLSPEADLLYLAAHLALQHGGDKSRLIWFYDLHLLVERWGASLDWQALFEQARACGWETALFSSLQGTQQRFGTNLPQAYLDELAMHQEMISLEVNPGLGREGTAYRQIWNMLAGQGRQRQGRLALGLIFPAPAYLRWRYHPRPGWIWPLCYPYRWLSLAAGLARALAGRQGGGKLRFPSDDR